MTMRKYYHWIWTALLCIATLAWLVGCGGGGSDNEVVQDDGPQAVLLAQASTSAVDPCIYPTWISGKSYVVGNIVTYPAGGKQYIATHANPGWIPTVSTYYWSPYVCNPPAPPVQVTAANCTYAAVAAAVAKAGTGTTVTIPAGTCNWGIQQLNIPAGIALRGVGKTQTIIRRVGWVPNSKYLVAFDCSNGLKATFSNMALVGNGNGGIQDKGLGLLNGCTDFRVFNSQFSNFIFSGVFVGDAPNQRGVIYQNNFVNNYSSALRNLGYGVAVFGGGVWPALALGTANAVFVEDNYFIGNRHSIASNNGSVYVFRHNTVVATDLLKDFRLTDAHGYSTSPRGSRSYEIYNNSYATNITTGLVRSAIGVRGGDGVIYNNVSSANIGRTVELLNEGFVCGAYPGRDQIRSLYIWNNTPNPRQGYTTNGIDNECPTSILLNRDYFLKVRPGYAPYTYPHPLR